MRSLRFSVVVDVVIFGDLSVRKMLENQPDVSCVPAYPAVETRDSLVLKSRTDARLNSSTVNSLVVFVFKCELSICVYLELLNDLK